jgi:outer membrane immunogenic protein
LGTVRGRVGFTPIDKLLLYATGGFAYARIEDDPSITLANGVNSSGFGIGFLCAANVTCFQGSSSRTATGGTAGAGAEYALSQNITVKAEYLFMSLNGASTPATALRVGGAIVNTNVPAYVTANYGRLDLHTVRFGLNYKFGGPAVARY